VPEPGEFYRFPNKCLHSHGAWGPPGLLRPAGHGHMRLRVASACCVHPLAPGCRLLLLFLLVHPPRRPLWLPRPLAWAAGPVIPLSPLLPQTPAPCRRSGLVFAHRTIFQYEILCIISARVWLLAACCARWCCVTLPHDLPLGTCRRSPSRYIIVYQLTGLTASASTPPMAHHWRSFHTQCGPRRLACE
jgi:hypothetical protein